MKSGYAVAIIQDWNAFQSLESEWNDLLLRSRADTIFLTHEWIRSWAAVVGDSVRPFVVAVRTENQNLIGIAPFYSTTYRFLRVIPYRVLRILGDHPPGAEYGNWIAPADIEESVFTTIAQALARSSWAWDCIWMPNMPGWNGSPARILTCCQAASLFSHSRPRTFSAVSLPPDMTTYLNRLPKKRRQHLRTEIIKVIERDGAIMRRCESLEELPVFLNALFDLHHRRWAKKGDAGTFRRRPLQVCFYEQFAALALSKGWLRLFGLQVNGEFKAIQIGYSYGKVFHALQEGFDPAYVAGVGNVLRYRAIEECITEGLSGYDFLGGIDEHKRRWLAEERTGYDLFIGHRSIKNLMLFAKQVWPTGRFLRPVGLPGETVAWLQSNPGAMAVSVPGSGGETG